MKNIVINRFGRRFLSEENKPLKEIIYLDELLDKSFHDFIFIKESINECILEINNKFYYFHKYPLYGNRFSYKFTNFSSRTKQPAAYFLLSKKEESFYIGSSGNVYARLMGHRTLFERSLHFNKKIAECVKRNGKEDLLCVVIYTSTKEEALTIEQELLDIYFNDPRNTNIGRNAKLPSLGLVTSDENKKAKSELFKNLWKNEEWRENITKKQKAAVTTPQYRRSVSDRMRVFLNTKKGEDFKLAAADRLNKRFSNPEERLAQSERIKKVMANPEHRARLSALKKRIAVSIDGVKYDGYSVAGKALGLEASLVHHRVKSGFPEWANWVKLNEFGEPDFANKKNVSREETWNAGIAKKKALAATPEHKAKMSKIAKAALNTPEVRRNFQLARMKQAQKVRINGIEYFSIAEASRLLNVSSDMIINRSKSHNPKFKNWEYVS